MFYFVNRQNRKLGKTIIERYYSILDFLIGNILNFVNNLFYKHLHIIIYR